MTTRQTDAHTAHGRQMTRQTDGTADAHTADDTDGTADAALADSGYLVTRRHGYGRYIIPDDSVTADDQPPDASARHASDAHTADDTAHDALDDTAAAAALEQMLLELPALDPMLDAALDPMLDQMLREHAALDAALDAELQPILDDYQLLTIRGINF